MGRGRFNYRGKTEASKQAFAGSLDATFASYKVQCSTPVGLFLCAHRSEQKENLGLS